MECIFRTVEYMNKLMQIKGYYSHNNLLGICCPTQAYSPKRKCNS